MPPTAATCPIRRRLAIAAAALAPLLAAGPAGPQPLAVVQGAALGGLGGGGTLLSPPSLPPTLPGGAPVPSLPDAAQQDILQRILEAAAAGAAARGATAGVRPGAGPLPAAMPLPRPQPAPAAPPVVATPAPGDEPLSPAEAFFAAREAAMLPPGAPTGPPLRQFGYEALRPAPGGPAPGAGAGGAVPAGLGFGALPDDYLLGRDDEVLVAFRGRVRQTMALRVARDGTLLVPDLTPVAAAGRTLRELRADLEARAARDLGGSEVFVSVGQVRQIAVFVGGEVARPGLQAMTAYASVLDALAAAGGVRRTGSLRAVRVEGGPGGPRTLDLYPGGGGGGGAPPPPAALALREGERVLVPPLGGVVAIGGDVTRPGIYELPAGAAAAPAAAMLALAGDPLRPGGNRLMLHTTDAGGRRAVQEVGPREPLRRGDALRVEPGTDAVANGVRLAGHVAGGAPVLRAATTFAASVPGRGGRGAGAGSGAGGGTTLRALLADPRLVRPDPYPLLGVVWRTDRRSRVRQFAPFDLAGVLRGEADMPLGEGDEVILLGLPDVLWLSSPAVQQALRGEAPAAPPPPGADPAAACPALAQVSLAAQSSRLRWAHARGAGFPDAAAAAACPQVFQDYPALLPFLLDQSAAVSGEVRLPGLYPLRPGTGLDAAVAAAGGLTETADLAAVELSREPAQPTGLLRMTRATLDLRGGLGAAQARLSPRDALRVPRSEGERDLGPVTLVGEFVRPGTYDIRRGERLSEAIARAGGLTPQAYPYGTVFSRESVRARQQDGFQRTARELELSLMQVATGQAVSGSRGAGNVDLGGAIQAGRELAGTLRQARAAGRMVVEANPVVLAARPELDVLLEPGDLIAVPKRPNEVTVVGAVLNPGSLQYAEGWRAADYVRAAGGRQRFADGGRTFIVLPNGQTAPAGQGTIERTFGGGGPPVPPGSMVVVPQDPSPYESWGLLRDAAQMLSPVALSAAALSVVARSGGVR